MDREDNLMPEETPEFWRGKYERMKKRAFYSQVIAFGCLFAGVAIGEYRQAKKLEEDTQKEKNITVEFKENSTTEVNSQSNKVMKLEL